MKLESNAITRLHPNARTPQPESLPAARPPTGRSPAGLVGHVVRLFALAALLWSVLGQEARAQATVMRGEVHGFFVMPFSKVPDDPEVIVFAELKLNGRLIFAPGGTAHLIASSVEEIEWSRVSGERYRYQLVDLQMKTSNTDNYHGQQTGTAHLAVTLLRIDRATSQPVAMVTGVGHVHVSSNLRNEHMTAVDRMDWTVSPLP